MKKIFFAAAALVFAASCSKTNNVESAWGGELRIASGIETRASGQTWEADDEIGVFMSEAGTETAVGAHNTKYATSSTSTAATFAVAENFVDLYYPQSGAVDVVAHYPYNAAATQTSYPVNVYYQNDLTAIDFMTAKVEGVKKSKDALNLNFYHVLSQLKVVLKPSSNNSVTAEQLSEATVNVAGTWVDATVNLAHNSITHKPKPTFQFSGSTENLTVTATNGVATFIILPQTATVTFTITIDGVGEFYVTTRDAVFTSGDEHTYTISVSKTAAKFEGAEINAWGTGVGGDLDASDLY